MFDRYEDLDGPPVGSYLTDGTSLVRVLESDQSGALTENALDDGWLGIEARDICRRGERCEPGRWRRVTPAI